jgi:hypothetical protein
MIKVPARGLLHVITHGASDLCSSSAVPEHCLNRNHRTDTPATSQHRSAGSVSSLACFILCAGMQRRSAVARAPPSAGGTGRACLCAVASLACFL